MSHGIPTRQKAVVVAEGGKVVLTEVDVPRPGPEQVLVKVVAAALNNCDWKTVIYAKALGAVVGSDFAGTIVEIGSDVSPGTRTIGERVAGFVHGGVKPNGTCAEYVVVDPHILITLPPSISFENGAQLGVSPFAAAQTLYTTHELPPVVRRPRRSETLLVFGGATCIGQYVIQLAKLGGLNIVACCCSRNFSLVEKIGADQVYDYTAPYMSNTVRIATGGHLRYAVDCVSERHSPRQVAWSLGSTGGIVAAIQRYGSPRLGVEVKSSTPFTLLPEDFSYPIEHKSDPAEIERGTVYAKLWTDILSKDMVQLAPINLLPDGLAGVEKGFEYMMEGKRKTALELPYGGKKKKQLQADEDAVVNGGVVSDEEMRPSSQKGSGQEDEDEDVEMNASGSEGEDEEWGGIGESDEAVDQKAKHGGGKPKKPPTGEEVREIKEATDLFRSSSFKLQIDALLPNVRPKESRKQPLERFLLVLHECLTSAPSVPPQHPLEAARLLLSSESTKLPKGKQIKNKGKAKAAPVPIAVPYPLPLPTEDANWKVAFEAPTDVLLVGSWANQVSVKAKDDEPWGVDLAVEMPATLFQEKDYMNGRFFHKRAFYLAVLARHLSSQSTLNVDLLYESKNGDPRATTLVLRPRNDGSPNDFTKLQAQVRIIPVLPSSSPIPLARLAPHRSNFRVHERSDASDAAEAPSSENRPTPLYNSAVLLSATPKPHLLSIHALKQNTPAYTDALALLRIWANQRGYGEGKRPSVSGFEGRGQWWSALLEALVNGEEPIDTTNNKGSAKRKPLGKGLSSYQLFKAALDFLARYDLIHERVFVKAKDGHRFPPQDYDAHHEVAFMDSSSLVNLLAGVSPSSLQMLRHDAKKTLQTLDNPISEDPFSEVFLKEHRDLFTRFDAVLRVDISTAKLRQPSVHATLEHGSPAQALFASLDSVLRRGLGQRVKALCILHPSSQPRPLSQAHPSAPAIVSIGLVFDIDHAFRLVDHGPAASKTESAAAEEFRDFWGDKAELRRFKDGSIVESVVWDVKNADERAFIPVMVVRHVLKRHLNVDADAVQAWQPAFDTTLRLPESISSILPSNGIQAGFKAAMTAFDGLVKAIKALDKELPLGVLNVSPISEYLRYTSVLSPTAVPVSSLSLLPECGRYQPVMDVVLEFEKSARWPDNLEAIQKTKLAFLERLASALMASVQSTTVRVVVGHSLGDSPICDQARLEIVTP
ncbi:hypothetical protein EWM64_g1615, partial [Hericium alpestre]